jgi:hypothetical protein
VTLQNRVLPTGEIVAVAGRGLFTGNRGILHGADRQLGKARWRHPHWIICALDFKDRRREVMAPGRWTELFFLDEAVALAAGHRPCAECRREQYLAFRSAWALASGARPAAPQMDAALHKARVEPRTRHQVRHGAPWADLPDAAFAWWESAAWLVLGDRLWRYSPAGYDASLPRPRVGLSEVLTPAPTLAALRAGYRAQLHPTARPQA